MRSPRSAQGISQNAYRDYFRYQRNQCASVVASTSILAHNCKTGRNRLLKSAARTRADDALTLTAATISPADPATGTASERIPSFSASSLIA
jgi:hypothetical protein